MIQSNSLVYNIVSDNELASILSYFDEDFVNNIITYNLQNKFKPYNPPIANLVNSFELQYNTIIDVYGNLEEIAQKRIHMYMHIIEFVCNYYNLDYSIEGADIYSAAHIIYELLISNFSNNIINFFTNYIIKERNTLYTGLNLAALKKNKDSSTLYSKKIFYKSVKIGAINANMELVLDSIKVFDIPFEEILSFIYPKNIVAFILSIIRPKEDFYKSVFVPMIDNPEYRPTLITSIRLNLQQQCANLQDLDI